MKRTQIHDIHSVAKYLLQEYSEGGVFNSESAYVEGVRLVKSYKLVDEVIEYALHRAVEFVLNAERNEVAAGRGVEEVGEGIFIGKPKKGERCHNEDAEQRLRDSFHTAIGLIKYSHKGVTKYLKDFTGVEAASWARTQIAAAGTQLRRAQAILKAAMKLKDPGQTLGEGLSKKQWSVFAAEYGTAEK